MDKFIQRVLACANIEENNNLVESFPIISFSYQNEEKRFLLFRFSNNGIPNYAVIGLVKENIAFDRESFLNWLQNLYQLIVSRPNSDRINLLKIFRESNYSKNILYTQEGFDLINGKQYFTVGGLISRTVLVSCHVCEDQSIEFYNEVKGNTYNQFLNGDLFQDYENYEQNYFLNYTEYHTMAYCNVLEYVQYNRNRLLKMANIKNHSVDVHYLIQLLDSYLANGLSEGYSRH